MSTQKAVTDFFIAFCNEGSIDTKYGAGCERACKNFQSHHGLSADGMCGKNTWNKLFSLGIR